jgi:hypothetical protein
MMASSRLVFPAPFGPMQVHRLPVRLQFGALIGAEIGEGEG